MINKEWRADLTAVEEKLSYLCDDNGFDEAVYAEVATLRSDILTEIAASWLRAGARGIARQRTLEAEREAQARAFQEAAEQRRRLNQRNSPEWLTANCVPDCSCPHTGANVVNYDVNKCCKYCEHEFTRYEEEKRREDERGRKYQAIMKAALDDYARHMHIEWTKQLLLSEIAMPDGSRTTWGAATIEQHQLRQEMLTRNAGANLEAAARHKKAIEDLQVANRQTLNELAEVLANV